MPDPDAPIVVAAFTGLDEAVVARGLLEGEGIETFLQNANLISIDWPLSQATGGVRLAVAARDQERARELLTSEPEAPAPGEQAEPIGPGDSLTERAWKSTLLGFFLVP